ncbi:hypothetical protein, partial [Dokdonella sp.]|uniref:hypothetical protein n=1 Tax=Dokdonella sp. TaxID=2291710 RepID=UPI002607D377
LHGARIIRKASKAVIWGAWGRKPIAPDRFLQCSMHLLQARPPSGTWLSYNSAVNGSSARHRVPQEGAIQARSQSESVDRIIPVVSI